MHVATPPQTKAPPTLADVEARLSELIELTRTVAEASQPRIVRSRMSVREKVEYINAHTPDEYLALPME